MVSYISHNAACLTADMNSLKGPISQVKNLFFQLWCFHLLFRSKCGNGMDGQYLYQLLQNWLGES